MKNKIRYFWPNIGGYRKKLPLETLIYCKKENAKPALYYENAKEPILIDQSQSLTDLETMLPANTFFRCNRSYIINIDFVDRYCEKNRYVYLTNGIRILIAEDRFDDFCKLLRERDG